MNNKVFPITRTPVKEPKPAQASTSTADLSNMILVKTEGLMQLLDCGRPMAVRVGMDAGARVCIGRNVRWHVPRVRQYLDTIADAQNPTL